MKKLFYSLLILAIAFCSEIPSSSNISEQEDIHDEQLLPQLLTTQGPSSNFDYLLKPFSSFSYLGNNPSNVKRSYVQGAQGLANDGINWFLANKETIYKWNGSYGFPSSLPPGSVVLSGMPSQLSGYDHFGDLDFDEDQDLLYVPLEHTGHAKAPKLVVFDSNLNYIDSDVLSRNDQEPKNETPWASIDPISKKIYTSKFDNVSELWIYTDLDNTSSLNLSYSGALQLKDQSGNPMTLNRVQGGEFSKSGHLFLYAEFSGSSSNAGIYVIDVTTGKQVNFKHVQINQSIFPWGKQEYEGITIWDLDNNPNNGGFGGQVHALLYEDSVYGKKFWLKHYRMSPSTEVLTPEIIGQVSNNNPYLEWDSMGSGYTYAVYQIDHRPNSNWLTLYTTTSYTYVTVNESLEDPSITGTYYPLSYYVIAKKNGLLGSKSNSAVFSVEYLNDGCDGEIFCIEGEQQ